MSNKTDTGGQVYPFLEFRTDRPSQVVMGITRRDYYAGLAMQGFLANPEFQEIAELEKEELSMWEMQAMASYKMADAMIQQGRKGVE